MKRYIDRFWVPCVFFLCLVAQAGAVSLDQCKAKFSNETGQSNPLQITYRQCVQTCGGGVGEFKWTIFSQDFSTWLLPWIALIFQLPFGATDRIDNLVSVLMAIGSPALAGYSLAITRLNSRWLSRQFMYLRFPNKDDIRQTISSLQHIPFKIETFGSVLPSLIVLPQNDRYWKALGVAARRTRKWSVPVAMNIIWVLVAFLFTIVDSFVDFDTFLIVPGDARYSIAAVWSYLLPVVVGWLHVGSQPEADHLRNALDNAHELAYVATDSEPIPATRVIGHSARAIEPSMRLIDYVNADEKKSAPTFNYARVFVWSQYAEHLLRLYECAAAKAERRIPVSHRREWISKDSCTIVDYDRIGNEVEVLRYCGEELQDLMYPDPSNRFLRSPTTPSAPQPATPVSPELPAVTYRADANDDVPVQLHWSPKYAEEAPPTKFGAAPEKAVFATGVLQRVALAAALALCLQWGTTGASILIHLNTPPKGIGCRVLTFVLYGAAGTVAFCLLLFSSVLAHLSRRQHDREQRSDFKVFIGCIAALTRWLGKLIAIANGFGILISCILQFAGVYDNCFCSSTIFGGSPDGLVSFTAPDIQGSEVYRYWIGGTFMAFGVSGLYTFAIYIATPMG